ncbi:MAG: hypothetical protein AAGG75_08905 [Bacteroidota bacterium]
MNPLKIALQQKIEEMIHMLEFRTHIHTQSIISPNELQLSQLSDSKRAVERLETTFAKNQQAEAVINECKEGINKLILIKEGIPNTDTYLLLQLFDNYFSYSMSQLYDQLKFEKPLEVIS